MTESLSVGISSPPDREYVVAEIFYGRDQVAEVNQEKGSLEVEIYPSRDGQPWTFNYEEWVDALKGAAARLDD